MFTFTFTFTLIGNGIHVHVNSSCFCLVAAVRLRKHSWFCRPANIEKFLLSGCPFQCKVVPAGASPEGSQPEARGSRLKSEVEWGFCGVAASSLPTS